MLPEQRASLGRNSLAIGIGICAVWGVFLVVVNLLDALLANWECTLGPVADNWSVAIGLFAGGITVGALAVGRGRTWGPLAWIVLQATAVPLWVFNCKVPAQSLCIVAGFFCAAVGMGLAVVVRGHVARARYCVPLRV
jgi:hypothetical protein